MDLPQALERVAQLGYDHRGEKAQAAQLHLRQLLRDPPVGLPVGLRLRVSGSGQSLPIVPWIALLDEEVTKTAKSGQYLVYLYRADLSLVYLSMNQGATAHQNEARRFGLTGVAADRRAF